MSRPPRPRTRPTLDHLTWQNVLVSYAVLAAIPLALWAVSHPLAGAVALVGATGIGLGVRRVHRLVRCFRECRGFAVDLFGNVRITVSQVPADDPC